MKVCILTHGYPRFLDDTTTPFIESIAETLQQHEGVDVTVLTPDTPQFSRTAADSTVKIQTYRYFYPRRLQLLGYSNTLVNDCALKKYVYLLAPFLFLSGIFHLFWLNRKHRFDVVHAQWLLPNGFIGAIVCKLCRIPLFITLQGSDIFVSNLNPIFKGMAKWTLKHAAMVTSVTPTFLPELAALGVPEEKQCMIPNGVTPSMFSTPSQKKITELREILSIPENDRVVFALGRIVLKKGFDVLIQALPHVQKKAQDVTVIIGGDGSDLPRLKTLAGEQEVSSIIRFSGTINRSDIPVYFHLCDLFVLPAVFDPEGNVDGCPNVILEAMACGKPVVSSEISGIPIVVKDGETGLLVDERNVDALATAIILLLENTSKREQFGRAGQQRIHQELTWKKITGQYISIYQHYINRNT